MDWNKKLQILLDIAKEAGAAILEIYRLSDLGIEAKDDESPLTIADKKANEVICKGLKTHFPDIPIISEENKEISYEERKKFKYFWLVDPLDGTKEFIKRNDEFTVNIALVHNEEVVGGVIYIPVFDDLYYAYLGEGSSRIYQNKMSKLTANSFKLDDAGLKVVSSRSHMNNETKTFIDKLNKPKLVSRGSSLKFLLLASGDAEIYPRLAPTMEWDTAAAQIILEEAGGKVIDARTNVKLKYNKEILRNPHFVAYAKKE